MQIETRDGAPERELLTAMIVHKGVLSRLAPHWQEPGPFRSRFANVVGKWCVDYLASHKDAPKRHVLTLFSAWAQRQGDEATVKLVEAFLVSISEEYEQADELKEDYLVGLAEDLFNQVRAERLKEQIDQLLSQGKTNQALEAISSFTRLEVTAASGVDVLNDKEFVKRTLSSKPREPLFRYPGDAGKFFDVPDCFDRDCFVAYWAPAKRGKSMWLIDVAWRLMEARQRVAFFEVGDMTERQIGTRLLTRAAQRPARPGTIKIPDGTIGSGKETRFTFREETYEKGLDGKTAWESLQEIVKRTVKSDKSYFRLSVHPARTLSVVGIEGILAGWRRQGFDEVSAIVIDYADLLSPISNKYDLRDQINETWAALRALSQKLHCLVVVASQTKASSYHGDLLTMDDFSDDRRKIDHLNACIGINQTSDEKLEGKQRLNFVALREGESHVAHCLHVANCFPLADPCYRSQL